MTTVPSPLRSPQTTQVTAQSEDGTHCRLQPLTASVRFSGLQTSERGPFRRRRPQQAPWQHPPGQLQLSGQRFPGCSLRQRVDSDVAVDVSVRVEHPRAAGGAGCSVAPVHSRQRAECQRHTHPPHASQLPSKRTSQRRHTQRPAHSEHCEYHES